MISVDQKSVQQCTAYVAERCWPRIVLLLFGAIVVIGSFLPFIYLQTDLLIRFVFSLVWAMFIVWHVFVTFVINLWNKKKKAWQLVLYGTARAHGCCKLFLLVFRCALPLALYILLWIPRILQSVPAYSVDAATFAIRNWIVFGLFIGLLFIGITTCMCVDYCCAFAPVATAQVLVPLEQMESQQHNGQHQHHHPYIEEQHRHSPEHSQHQLQHHSHHTAHPHQHRHQHQHHATIEYLESESGEHVMVIEEIK